MTEIYIDTEFIEDGRTIDLISIGMVTEDGRELYAVNGEMPVRRIRKHDWLMEHVVPSLPKFSGDARLFAPKRWLFNYSDPCVYKRSQIAGMVLRFIQKTPDPQLWAWYGAYDHVVLAQLWGRMISLPSDIPMWTNDLKQECVRLGNPELPPMPGHREHHALDDAREVRYRRQWLRGKEAAAR